MQKDLRSYILTRIQSPLTTIEQFNWDNLRAPSISELFSPQDLSLLHNYATSLKLSAKTKEKIALIDRLMYARGFRRFITGTNRLTYAFIEDTSFIAKVAYNNVGTTDAPREYQNQMVLKPFVPKIFEYTPDGVLSIEERVEPITNREEFMSIAQDVYTLITEWLIGEYVFDDIGTNYFMNYGIRKGFGVVILDFPYMFKVDYGKLICAAKDSTTLSGTCEGEIDYDDGFNKLYCTKCGAIYRAIDLGKQVSDEKVMIRPTKGGIEMFNINLNLTGGSKNMNTHQTLGGNPYTGFTPMKPIAPVIKQEKKEEPVKEEKPVVDVMPPKEKTITTPVGVNGVVVEDRPEAVHEVDDEKPVGAVTEEFFNDEEKKEPVKEEALESPMSIHDDDEEFKAKAKEESLDSVISDDIVKKLFGDDIMNKVESVKDIIDKMSKEELMDIIKHIFTKITIEAGEANSLKLTTADIEDSDSIEGVEFNIQPEIQLVEDETVLDIDPQVLSVFIPLDVLVNLASTFKSNNDENAEYSGNFIEYAAATINKKDVNQHSINERVFALIADNGNYLTDKFGNIICVSKIDNKFVSNVSVMSDNNRIGDVKQVDNLKPGAVQK